MGLIAYSVVLLIDNGRMVGPKMHITAPYLEGARPVGVNAMHDLTGPHDARRMVNFWADQGATSFKVYENITGDELRAVVEEAHKRGLKVTGHPVQSVIAKPRRSASIISNMASWQILNLSPTNNRANARGL